MGLRGKDEAASREELARGDRFLAAFNVIDRAMRRKYGDPGAKEGFRRLVDLLVDRDWTVRKFREDLVEFAELRNAIVHDRISPTYLIAVPLPGTVERIERIAASIERPPLVYPQFKRDVACFSPDDKMDSVFRTMAATGYSQFPVYRGTNYIGLLTDGGIARYLASALSKNVQDRPADPGQASVGEVLKSEKNPDRARFIPRTATIYQAEHLFVGQAQGKWRVSALLITETGMTEEKLLGIVTPSDVLAFMRE